MRIIEREYSKRKGWTKYQRSAEKSLKDHNSWGRELKRLTDDTANVLQGGGI